MISEWHKTDAREEKVKDYRLHLSVSSKICSKCKCEKLTHHFSLDRSRKDGLSFYCKQCDYLNKSGNVSKVIYADF